MSSKHLLLFIIILFISIFILRIYGFNERNHQLISIMNGG